MSAALDAALVRREPGLPGLAVLLDARAFARALADALPEAGIQGAMPTYLRYKPQTSCLAAYRLATASGPVAAYARAHRPSAPEKLRSARRASAKDSPLGPGGVVLADLAIAVHAFPHDRRLPALARMTDGPRRRDLLRRALPEHARMWDGRLRTLRYNPERRWVAVVEAASGERALLKLHAEVPAGGSAAPRLGLLAEHHLVVHPWVDGRPLDEALTSGSAGACSAARQAGGALAALHLGAGPLDSVLLARHPRPPDLDARLQGAADAVAWLCPPLAGLAFALATQLGSEDEDVSSSCPVHGDWSADQVVVGPTGVSIIDLDGAHRGDPTGDLGSFIADLEARVLADGMAARTASAASRAMLEGYRAADGPATTDPRALARAAAAGLLLRAVEPFRTCDPRWGARTAAHLRRAEQLAGSAVSATASDALP